jgi:hypothetical protein
VSKKDPSFIMMRSFFAFILTAALCVGAGSAQQLDTPINVIQGSDDISAKVGQKISTRGVVTAVTRLGFFLQTPDAEADKDPKTSEGIFVFCAGEIPKAAVVGRFVQVTGTVSEFKPREDRYALPITQLTRPVVRAIAKDIPMPVAVTLTAGDLDPKGPVNQMERLEGMRVRIDSVTATQPTGERSLKDTGEIVSDGVFYATLSGVQRPFREPGVDVLRAVLGKMPQTVKTFDMNPEILRFDSDEQAGAKPLDVPAGKIVKNISGVVSYSYRRYEVLLDANITPTLEGGRVMVPARGAGQRELSISSFNLENFFDDEKNSDIAEETMVSKEAFLGRLNKASMAIRKGLGYPDILGVIEVENLKVLNKLAAKINADAMADGQSDPKYEAHLEEGNDGRGIDVGFLVKTAKVKATGFEQLGKAEKFENPTDKAPISVFDRPPYLLKAEVVDAKGGQPFQVTVVVNHLKSLAGIDDEKIGESVQTKRKLQAEWLAKWMAERNRANPAERLVVCGDLNTFEFSDGYVDVMGILLGKSEPASLMPSALNAATGMANMGLSIPNNLRYSFVFNGSAQTLDHILVNEGAYMRALRFGYARFNADFPGILKKDVTRPERVSDHDPAWLILSLDELKTN